MSNKEPMKWDDPITIDGEATTPFEWLSKRYMEYTDNEIVGILTNAGVENVTLWAVHSKRNDNGLIKGPTLTTGTDETIGTEQDDEHPNYLHAFSRSTRIRTAEELIDELEIDTEEWELARFKIRKWDVPFKDEDKSLVFDDARMNGHIYSQTSIETMYYVDASFIRKEPVVLQPHLQPIAAAEPIKRVPNASKSNGLASSLIWADPQFGFRRQIHDSALIQPFHDRRILDIILQVATDLQPDRIDVLGDNLDLTMWTDFYLRSPEYEYATQPALVEFYWWLAQLRLACPSSEINVHPGNHDQRVKNQMIKHLKPAYGLRRVTDIEGWPVLSVPHLLALDTLDVNWLSDYPKDDDWLNSNIKLVHGENYSSTPGNTARKVVADSPVNIVFGHSHTFESASRTLHYRDDIREISAYGVGCTCHIDGRVPGKKAQPQWQQGFAIVHYDLFGEDYNFQGIRARNGRAVVGNNVYTARDRLGDLRRAYPRWNWSE